MIEGHDISLFSTAPFGVFTTSTQDAKTRRQLCACAVNLSDENLYHPTPPLRPAHEYGFYASTELQRQGRLRSSATRHPETRAAGVATLDIALAPAIRSDIDTTTSPHIAVADSNQDEHIERRRSSKPLRRAAEEQGYGYGLAGYAIDVTHLRPWRVQVYEHRDWWEESKAPSNA
ncbi:hypothetical protein PG985_005560 [Apiospora marii]|uniref:uncharacterized protein n=1 Tax=Apiospora marii TaxID=335849 RepID=UPI00312F367B